jgi:hypothetical protein
MYVRRNETDSRALRDRLMAATGDPARHCPAPYLDGGKPYRLEPKPKGRRAVLERYGHECEVKDGVLHVRVPLGPHGADHLGIDPVTGEVACVHPDCRKGN